MNNKLLVKNAPMIDKTISLQQIWGFNTNNPPLVNIESVKNCLNQLEEEVKEIQEDVIDGYENGKSQEQLQKELVDVALDIIEYTNQMIVRNGLVELFKESSDKIYRNNASKVCESIDVAMKTVTMYESINESVYVDEVDNYYVVKRASDNKVMKPFGFKSVEL